MNVKIYKERSEDKSNNSNKIFLLNRYWPKKRGFFWPEAIIFNSDSYWKVYHKITKF